MSEPSRDVLLAISKLLQISDDLNDVAKLLRVPSRRGPLNGAWTATLGGLSDACSGLVTALEVFGNDEPTE